MVGQSIALFAAAAVAEIGGAYLVWQGLREGKGGWLVVIGGLALGYGIIATLQPDTPAAGLTRTTGPSGEGVRPQVPPARQVPCQFASEIGSHPEAIPDHAQRLIDALESGFAGGSISDESLADAVSILRIAHPDLRSSR